MLKYVRWLLNIPANRMIIPQAIKEVMQLQCFLYVKLDNLEVQHLVALETIQCHASFNSVSFLIGCYS